MADAKGKAVLLRLKRTWMLQKLLVALLLAIAVSLLASALSYILLSVSFYWSIPLAVLVFISYSLSSRWWKGSEWEIARLLNQTEPALQESTELVLQPAGNLSLLQRLQQQRAEAVLATLKPPHLLRRQIGKAVLALLFAAILSAVVLYWPYQKKSSQRMAGTAAIETAAPVLPASIRAVSITVIPPAYTGKPARKQTGMDVQVEEGGSIRWQIEATGTPQKLQLHFNDGTVVPLLNKSTMIFTAQKTIARSGFYQLKLGDTVSELYKIEAVKDKAPTVAIQTPKPATTVGFGQSMIIPLQALVRDDYGIQSAGISVTLSSGEGEAVKFKQQTLSFGSFRPGGRQYTLQENLDLKTLGMEPGNQLYFFLTVTDNHRQETRSDVHIITLEDTTVESSMDGMLNGLNVKPDLFRSQRQIIIETEQLLQDRNTIPVQAFQQKSDDLGVDQKLLRLRYGKFLGEETDTEIGGHEHGGEEHHGEESYTNNANEMVKEFGHSHDNAEDATFFDAATKKQLKETLAEMWKAELQLRTFKPKEALVFEYKALRLLKDLQQKSRAYVAKTGFTPTPLKLEKRLTGELDKIGQPINQQQFDSPVSTEQAARRAISELEQLKVDGLLQSSQQTILQQAFQQLSNRAAQAPATFLPALSALQKVLNGSFRLQQIRTAQNGLQQMLPPPPKLPFAPGSTSAKNLSDRYFSNLNGGSFRK